MAKPAQTAVKGVPFKTKLKAWWEGYDAHALHEHLTGAVEAKPAAKSSAPMAPILATPLQGASPQPAKLEDPWDEARVDVAQLIWGEGYCGPGGPEHVIAMSKLLALNSEMSLLYMGAGLGGAARALAAEFGVWVTGLESSIVLTDAGNALSRKAGMAKKAELAVADTIAAPAFQRHYDRAIIDNFCAHTEDVTQWLGAIYQALKPDSLLLLTDLFVVDEPARNTKHYSDWLAGEPSAPNVPSLDPTVKTLKSLGLTVRVDEDISSDYAQAIQQTWGSAATVVARLMSDPASREHARILLKEAEIWNRRVAIMKDGAIQYRRIVAQKR